MVVTRRDFLKQISLCSMGVVVSPSIFPGRLKSSPLDPESTVYLVSGRDRRNMMVDVLEPLKESISSGIENKQILLKPNCVWDTVLCATHVDALRGVLDVLRTLTDRRIIIGESTANIEAGTLGVFETLGYNALLGEYDNLELMDLNTRQTMDIDGFHDESGSYANIGIIDTFLDPETYIISVTRPKSHNHVVATMTVKNVLMAAPVINREMHGKNMMHVVEHRDIRTCEYVSRNIAHLANSVMPHLAVIDGLEGLQGDGPVDFNPHTTFGVDHNVALAGTDAVAVDSVMAGMMGIDIWELMYLYWCGEAGLGNFYPSRIRVVGEDPDDHVVPYDLHRDYPRIVEWVPSVSVTSPEQIERRSPAPFLQVFSNISPMSPSVEITYSLSAMSDVRLALFDFRGREIRTFVSGPQQSGKYHLQWEGRDNYGARVASGIYHAVLKTGSGMCSKTLTVSR